MRLHIPYGERLFELDVEGIEVNTYLPSPAHPVENFFEELLKRLNSPLDTMALSYLCKGKKEACIVVDDNTRPPTGKMVLPHLLSYLRSSGVERVTIILALGLHSPLNREQMEKLLGDLPESIRVINHNPEGELKETAIIDNIHVELNPIFLNSPLKIVIGDVELHQIFGYGGGAKSIVPGISDRKTITYLHSMLTHPNSAPGILNGNPVQQFLKKIYRKVAVDFSIHVAMNQEGRPVGIFTGSLYRTFMEGVRLVDRIYKLKVGKKLDTLIVSPGGYPRDIDLYQTQKVITMVSNALEKGGRLVIFSECKRGIGPMDFIKWLNKGLSGADVEAEINRRFSMGLHKLYLFYKGTRDRKVYLFSSLDPVSVHSAFLSPVDVKGIKRILKYGKRGGFVPYATTTLLHS
ncbi:MAG TPA: nickel-dependent lactate racemase [Candidatus Omnitrophica bacterium]|nr:nickel-dependent lactate racemase [Candidatus Omnitrophota bacterium]